MSVSFSLMKWFMSFVRQEPPQRRVFLVIDDSLQEALLEVLRARVEEVNAIARVCVDGTKGACETRASSSRGIEGVIDWPASGKMMRTNSGVYIVKDDPEIILDEGQVFLTVPDAGYLVWKKEHEGWDTDSTMAAIEEWVPPPGLFALEKTFFGRDPIGFPRIFPSDQALRRFGLPVPDLAPAIKAAGEYLDKLESTLPRPR